MQTPIIATLIFSIVILIIGVILTLLKKPVGKAVTVMGAGLLITFLFYYAFVAAGVYGKPPEKIGYALNILGLIVLVVGAGLAIHVIKKIRLKEVTK